MWYFIIRRVVFAIPILLGVSAIVFSLVHLGPGDPVSAVVPADAPQETVDRLRKDLGFDKPLPVQYISWLGRILSGDLGNSVATSRPVWEELKGAVGNTFIIAVAAAIVGFSAGCTAGALAAYWHGRFWDKAATAFAITGVSLPHYWVGILLVIIFSVELNWLPAMGIGGAGEWSSEMFRHMIMPVATLALIPMGVVARMVRASILEVLGQEFVLALHSKGLLMKRVVRHVVKNAAPSVLAVMGIQFGYMLGGSILVETVFNWPGSGLLMNEAIFKRDLPVLQGVILVLAAFFVILNLLVDILQSVIDPRIRR